MKTIIDGIAYLITQNNQFVLIPLNLFEKGEKNYVAN